MNDDLYSFALRTTLDEIRNICPEIMNTFMFTEDGHIVGADEKTSERTMTQVIDTFDKLLEKAEIIGGAQSVAIQGSKNRVDISRVNDLYLVTVTSRKADMTYVNTVTRVLVPTMLKLIDKIHPASTSPKGKSSIPQIENERQDFEESQQEENENVEESLIPEKSKRPAALDTESEATLNETPVNQLIVENLGGLLVPSDTVRIDSQILSQWENLYEGKKITEVQIETFDGKTTRCKLKPIKESKYEGKGIVQIPDKMQSALEIKKGELVRAKPIVE